MGDSDKTILGTTPSLPRWLEKTHCRYDQDDIAFSPPNDGGSTFFSLHVGQSEKTHAGNTHKSTFDRINEELGFVEVSSDRRLSVGLSTGLSGRGSGLCLNTELQQSVQEERIENSARNDLAQTVKPLLILQNPFATRKQNEQPTPDPNPESSLLPASPPHPADSNEELKLSSKLSPFATNVATENETEKSANEKSSLKKELNEQPEGRQLGLLSRVKNLVFQSFTSASEDQIISGPTSEPVAVPFPKTSAPSKKAHELTAGVDLEHQSHKEFTSTGGVIVERKMEAYNSYFYRPDDRVVAVSSAGGSEGGQVVIAGEGTGKLQSSPSRPSATGGDMTVAQANEMAPGKPRRPKPSKLREMNFWAPTSM